MKNFLLKFFSWIKDHFSILFAVFFRLHIGQIEKQNPNADEIEDSSANTSSRIKTEQLDD